jgi:effector-binding domain-containing protein
MRFLKILGAFLLILVVLFMLLGLILPKEYDVSRSVLIDAPRSLVFQHVRTLTVMETWSPWADRDPDQELRLEGEDGTVGATMYWSGNKEVGKGLQRIVDIIENERVATQLVFIEPFSSEADVSLLLSEEADGVEVTWSMNSTMAFPWNALMPFMGIEKAIGKDFEDGLGRLKAIVEGKVRQPVYGGFNIRIEDHPPTTYIGYRSRVRWDDLEAFFARQMPALYRESMRQKAEKAGPPSALYYEWDEVSQTADIALVLPVAAAVALKGGMVEELPGGRMAVIEYMGPYQGTGAAHEAMDAFMADFGYQVVAPVIEAYVTDPAKEPDTSKWLTRVMYPLGGTGN